MPWHLIKLQLNNYNDIALVSFVIVQDICVPWKLLVSIRKIIKYTTNLTAELKIKFADSWIHINSESQSNYSLKTRICISHFYLNLRSYDDLSYWFCSQSCLFTDEGTVGITLFWYCVLISPLFILIRNFRGYWHYCIFSHVFYSFH